MIRAMLLFAVLVLPGGALVERTTLPSGGAAEITITETPDATAIALMMVGGNGIVTSDSKNFLARARKDFADAGMIVAMVQIGRDRLSASERVSSEHAGDLARIARTLEQRFERPVWGIGTSRGTLSIANLAAHHPKALAGVVLSSSLTRPRPGSALAASAPNGVFGLPLAQISVPTLVIWHADDQCAVTPPADQPRLARALSSSMVETRAMTGGLPGPAPCKGLSHHGYLGIERKTVAVIAEFIHRASARSGVRGKAP